MTGYPTPSRRRAAPAPDGAGFCESCGHAPGRGCPGRCVTRGAAMYVSDLTESGVLVIIATGDLDRWCADAAREFFLGEIAAAPGRVIIDLRQVTYLDSDGLAALLSARRAARYDLVAVSGRVLTRLRVMGLAGRVFEVYPTISAALAADSEVRHAA